MIESYDPVLQALLGTLFTWGVTALGAALVFVVDCVPLTQRSEKRVLDVSLGFAAGVMLAASYWSLLAPAIEQAEEMGWGDMSWVPALVGFLLGGAGMECADAILSWMQSISRSAEDVSENSEGRDGKGESKLPLSTRSSTEHVLRRRKGRSLDADREGHATFDEHVDSKKHGDGREEDLITQVATNSVSWRRTMLLIIAITLHNAPEGAAVGVGFGALSAFKKGSDHARRAFLHARSLAIGIGLQNFPEGLAVSLPLRRAGVSSGVAFFFGQLSGMVEPLAGLFGAWCVTIAQPVLPFALAFAAGAMVYVVVDEVLPETFTGPVVDKASGSKEKGHNDVQENNGKAVSWGVMVGFAIMMTMDVALG